MTLLLVLGLLYMLAALCVPVLVMLFFLSWHATFLAGLVIRNE
jgi:hypothetical protein